jgi:mono/diheme cytochrome c family protein
MINTKNRLAYFITGILALLASGCAGNARDGAILFERERCIYCHSFKGHGAHVGPDLTEIAKRRSDAWIRDQIRNPRLHHPNPGMPGHEYLSQSQIDALLRYLKS